MHNLAIALKLKGYEVSGSDDEIFEPSGSRLEKYGLLPPSYGFFPEKITSGIDTIILGMHAREDNPELKRARELGLVIKSFPEFLYEQTKDKRRIVVAGSHGKTTTTAMIMHVLRYAGLHFDYMVGSQIDGFETMVGLSNDSELAVFEGDEYLTSTLDKRPKFHLYMPDIAILNGISWDHKNVFPTFENYIDQFRIFISMISANGTLIYYEGDENVRDLVQEFRGKIRMIPYNVHEFIQNEEGFFGLSQGKRIALKIFGEHNMQNLSAAKEACIAAGVTEDLFYSAIMSFEGTAKRLQKLAENEKGIVFLDFAHSPSKVRATIEAVRSRYPGRQVIACLELHTYSSLSQDFLPQYEGSMKEATKAFVYFNPHAVKLKKLEPLSADFILRSFGQKDLHVFDNSADLFSALNELKQNNPVFLMMSSGDFDGINIRQLID